MPRGSITPFLPAPPVDMPVDSVDDDAPSSDTSWMHQPMSPLAPPSPSDGMESGRRVGNVVFTTGAGAGSPLCDDETTMSFPLGARDVCASAPSPCHC